MVSSSFLDPVDIVIELTDDIVGGGGSQCLQGFCGQLVGQCEVLGVA